MKHLFLCSYFAGVADLFQQYAQEAGLEKKLLFIPTAGNVEEYRGYIDEGLQAFEDMGFQVEVLDIADCSQETAQANIFQTNLLYISGGNTFYLLQELKKKDLLKLIREKVAGGMLYIGESAGAIVTAPDIAYSALMDDKECAKDLADYAALGLIDAFFLPHFGEEPFVESTQAIQETYGPVLKLLALNNHEAVIIAENSQKIVGRTSE